jgi:hypothetical protein
MDVLREQKRGARVPEVVEADLREPRLPREVTQERLEGNVHGRTPCLHCTSESPYPYVAFLGHGPISSGGAEDFRGGPY